MANVLVVGGAGYLGGAVTDELQNTDHNVRVYDALLYEERYLKDTSFVLGDVRDTQRLLPQLEWADTVIWLAALVGDGACAADPELTKEINTTALEWAHRHFNGRFLFPSTCSVYGANDALLDEESELNPLSVYAETKVDAEGFLKERAMVFRLGTLFGLGDDHSRIRLDLVINVLTLKALYEGKVQIFGGDQYRPILHVRDAARAIASNVETDHIGIYDLHHSNVRIRDLPEYLNEHFPDLTVEYTEASFEDNRNYRVTSDKARNAFGFNPMFSVSDGIVEMRALLAAQRIKDVNSHVYSNSAYVRTLLNNGELGRLDVYAEGD
jgi:nucleoside-diphosphate-sugar epimerase